MNEPLIENPHFPILLVDDEVRTLQTYEMLLKKEGFNNVALLTSGQAAVDFFKEKKVSLIILDLGMRGISGQELLEKLSSGYPEVPIIVATAFNDVSIVVECMKKGAYDYLVKPIERTRFIITIRNALKLRALENENIRLQNSLLEGCVENLPLYQKIITDSESMFSIFRYVDSISVTSQPVLITGETGTGKELIAEAVHKASGRKGQFVSINVAGLDDTTFSDTLFGHRAGAYTGAHEARKGLVENASGGTLFLDEIGDLKDSSQVKLLRLMQENEYYTLGSDTPAKASARIVTASNKNLAEMKDNGTFRKDLYYRLNKHHIHLPPLRERTSDIAPLVNFFIEKSSKELGVSIPKVPDGLTELLREYSFPGNIRELEGIIFDAISSPPFGKIMLNYFQNYSTSSRANLSETFPDNQNLYSNIAKIEDAENMLIEKAMDVTGGNLTHAARKLGISRSTLYRKISRKN
ncbi:MAG: hypothetical protein A2020_08150 [Lentisphaerae bacterium GWF2_45_14]|nr:MAG: hypothetical protein A2020_08150 [Lentisphaerae bacterium GWF2_45_14]